MKHKTLVPVLKEYGISSTEIRDLLLYTLNTKDRQDQLLSWILANEDACNKETIRAKAQELLQNFLATNPYHAAAKNMPPPKWEPPAPKPTAVITPPEETTAQVEEAPPPKESSEDTYYKRLLDVFKL